MDVVLCAILSVPIFVILFYLYLTFIWAPLRIQRHFRQQGVGGPTYNPISGNVSELQRLMMAEEVKPKSKSKLKSTSLNNEEVVKRIMPHFYVWSKVYGDPILFWFGRNPRLAISKPEMVKEIMLNTNGVFVKTEISPLVKALFGKGLAYIEGEEWVFHRKITSQAYNMERVKELIPEIVASTKSLLDKWELQLGEEKKLELDVYKEFSDMSSDVISRTAFGSSFEEGRRIFELLDRLIIIVGDALRSVYLPGFKYLPTKKNRLIWKLQREVEELIIKMIEKNKRIRETPKALLSLLLSSYKTTSNVKKRLTLEEILGECKTFYVAGKESTANLLSWTFLLLASHPEWQHKAREEVLEICGDKELPTAEHIANLKIITMILNETLRLYPPAVISVREASKNVKLGNLHIPAKTQLLVAMAAVHHDAEIWGDDVQEFNPMRFLEPNKNLASYFPFGLGPRICVGQNLAVVEAKITLAMIIREYSFMVSPSYVHAPKQFLTIQPQYGAQIIFSRV